MCCSFTYRIPIGIVAYRCDLFRFRGESGLEEALAVRFR